MKKYLVFDIGCLECGESSNVVGVYDSEERAESEAEKAEEEQRKSWTGQHRFEVFEIEV